MSALVLTNPVVLLGAAFSATAPGVPGTQTIAGTITSTSDISGYTTAASFPITAEMKKTTNFGSGGYVTERPGLKSGQLQLTLQNDYAASALDAILRTTLGFGTYVFVDIKPTNAARSATNPSFVAAFWLSTYTGISGSVGDVNGFSATYDLDGAFGWLTS